MYISAEGTNKANNGNVVVAAVSPGGDDGFEGGFDSGDGVGSRDYDIAGKMEVNLESRGCRVRRTVGRLRPLFASIFYP
jgi:hypothetical protein